MFGCEFEIPFITLNELTKKFEINPKCIEWLSSMEEKIISIGVVNNFRMGKGLFPNDLGSPQKSTKILKNKPGIYLNNNIEEEASIIYLDVKYTEGNLRLKTMLEMIMIFISSKIVINFYTIDELMLSLEGISRVISNTSNFNFSEISFAFLYQSNQEENHKSLESISNRIKNYPIFSNFKVLSLKSSFMDSNQKASALKTQLLDQLDKKTIFSFSLNGIHFADFILFLLTELNEGKPIDFCFIFDELSKIESEQAGKESLELYEGSMQENVVGGLPLPNDELKRIHRELKKSSIELFEQKKFGEGFGGSFDKMVEKIKEKYREICFLNENAANEKCLNFINEEFKYIENKLKDEIYSNFDEFEKELSIFKEFCLEQNFDYSNRDKTILEFINKALKIGFAKIGKIKDSKSKKESSFYDTNSVNISNSEVKSKLYEMEENLKLKERENTFLNSELKKEIALITQKNEMLEKKIDELTKKEKNFVNDMKNLKKEHYAEIKELTLKYEQINTTQEITIKELNDKISDYEAETKNYESNLQAQKDNLLFSEKRFSESLKENESLISNMRKELHEQKLKDDKFSKGFKEEADKKISDLNLLIVNLEEALRAKEKNLRELKQQSDKDKAVSDQKLRFLELELAELKSRLEEKNPINQVFLQAIELTSDYAKKTDEKLKNDTIENWRKECQKLEHDLECLKSKEIEKNNKIFELNKEIKFLKGELEKKEQLQDLEIIGSNNNSTLSSTSFFDRIRESGKLSVSINKKLVEDLYEDNNKLIGKLAAKKQKKNKIVSDFAEQISLLNKQISTLQCETEALHIKEQNNIDFFNKKTEELLASKEACETRFNDLHTLYEQEKQLWESKLSYLETQNTISQSEFLDSQKKFEQTIVQFQSIRQEKDDKLTAQANLLQVFEKKMEVKLNELTDYYERKLKESDRKVKELDLKLGEAKSNNRINSYSIETLRKNWFETSPNLCDIDLEKEALKNRIYELELQLKESEAKKNMHLSELNRRLAIEDTEKKSNNPCKSFEKLRLDKENERKSKEWKNYNKSINIYSTRNLDSQFSKGTLNHWKKNSLSDKSGFLDKVGVSSTTHNESNKSSFLTKGMLDDDELLFEIKKK